VIHLHKKYAVVLFITLFFEKSKRESSLLEKTGIEISIMEISETLYI